MNSARPAQAGLAFFLSLPQKRSVRHPMSFRSSRTSDSDLALVLRVLSESGRGHPADAALREALREERGMSPEARAWVSQAVHTHARWRGFLESPVPSRESVQEALGWARRSEENPGGFEESAFERHAVPDWIHAHLDAEPGWFRALQRDPMLWLRTPRRWTLELPRWLPEVSPGPLPDSWRYEGERDLWREEAFQEGKFEMQDLSSQGVGSICGARAGETWWDVCAGEGGKTLHLSDLMESRGLIWATDRSERRLRRLRMRAARARVFNYRTRTWLGEGKPPMKTLCDGVLVDAPCSGVGTWQRNPHARWVLEPRDIEELSVVQARLLRWASSRVKPGGRLIYSVCTMTRAETWGVVDAFQREVQGFDPCAQADPFDARAEARPARFFWPQTNGGNGMFVATWKRKD